MYVELHFHLLPDIDDGPRTDADSIALAAAAVADGTGIVVATPHVHPAHVTEPMQIADRVRALVDVLRGAGIELTVIPGGELAHDMVGRLSQRELDTIAQGPRGRRWVLLEAPFAGLDGDFTAAAGELRSRGFAVVVAHPERVEPTEATAAAIAHELAAGSVLQLTAASALGDNGDGARTEAVAFLSTAPRAVIASDAHGSHRPPQLKPALAALTAMGEAAPDRFAATIPLALLEQGLEHGRGSLAA
jgi:protein-tyrosine phosphatase